MESVKKIVEPIDFTSKFDIWINGTTGQMIIFDIHNADGKVNYIDNEKKTYDELLQILYHWKLDRHDVRHLELPDNPKEKLKEMKELHDMIVEAKKNRKELDSILEKHPNVIDFSAFKKKIKNKKK